MALNLGVLTVQVGADISGLVQGFQNAGRMVRLLETQFVGLQRTTAQLTTTMGQTATATKAVGASAQTAAKGIAGIGQHAHNGAKQLNTFTERLTHMSNRIHLMFGGVALTAAFTMPFLAFGKAALNSAIGFESAFAGVRKTVDATEQEFSLLSQTFRNMSQEMPITAGEFARIGELAGQLGIRGVQNITKFSEVVAKMAVTTNLGSDQAATGMARLSNILQLPIQEAEKMGSVIVELGNNLAVFEDEILEFALRIAGAGKQIGLSLDQILGFSAAIPSVGIKAEAGGTAIQRVFLNVSQAVAMGGEQLKTFASVARMSTDAFAQTFRDNAGEAIVAFIEGLKQIQDEGGNVFQVLRDLDVNEQRILRTLLSTAGAGDLLRRSLGLAATEIGKVNALNEEAAKRFGTTESQLKTLRNTWDEFLRQTGEVAIPMLGDLLQILKGTAQAMQGWSDGTKMAAVSVFALAAVVGPFLLGLSLIGASISGWQKMLEIFGLSGVVANKVLLLAGAVAFLTKVVKEGVSELRSWWTELDKVRTMQDQGGKFNLAALIPRPFAAIRPQDFVQRPPVVQFSQRELDDEIERFRRATETYRRLQEQQREAILETNKSVGAQFDAMAILEIALRDLSMQSQIYSVQASGMGGTVENLTSRQQILSKVLENQKLQVMVLNKQYENAIIAHGLLGDKTLEAREALDKMRLSTAETVAALQALGRSVDQLEMDRVQLGARLIEDELSILQVSTQGAANTYAVLTKQQELLQRSLETGQQRVGLLTSRYDQMAAALGPTSEYTMELQLSLSAAKKELAQTNAALLQTQHAVEQLEINKVAFDLERANNAWSVFELSTSAAAESLEFLSKRKNDLTKRMELATRQTNLLQEQYDNTLQTQDQYAENTMTLAVALDKARIEEARLAAAIRETDAALGNIEPLRQLQEALEQAADASASAKSAYENFGAQLEKAEATLKATKSEIDKLNTVISESESVIKNAFGIMQSHVDSFDTAIKDSEQTIRDAFSVMEDHVRSFDDRIKDARGSINQAFGDMRDQIADISRQADEARRSIDNLLNIPFKGTGAIEQQLFALAQQERQVSLQSVKVRQRLAVAAPGERTGLEATLDALRAQSEQLRMQQEEIRLRADIEFEPMRRELEQMINVVEEMSFDEIKAAIQQQQKLAERLDSQGQAAADSLEKLQRDAANALGDPKKLGFQEAAELIRVQIGAIEDLTHSQKQAQSAVDELRDRLSGSIFPIQQTFDQAVRSVEGHVVKIRDLTIAQDVAKETLDRLTQSVRDVLDLTKPTFEQASRLVAQHAEAIRVVRQRLDEDLLPAYKRQQDAVSFLTVAVEGHRELLDKRMQQEKELEEVLQALKSGATSAADALLRLSQIKASAPVTPPATTVPESWMLVPTQPAVPTTPVVPATPLAPTVPIIPPKGIVPTIRPFADGGIVTRPTLGMIGEAGPEAVVPLSGGRGLGGSITFGRGSIVVNGANNPAETAEEIYDRLVRRLRREGIVIN